VGVDPVTAVLEQSMSSSHSTQIRRLSEHLSPV
jgi:hypothetical protein